MDVSVYWRTILQKSVNVATAGRCSVLQSVHLWGSHLSRHNVIFLLYPFRCDICPTARIEGKCLHNILPSFDLLLLRGWSWRGIQLQSDHLKLETRSVSWPPHVNLTQSKGFADARFWWESVGTMEICSGFFWCLFVCNFGEPTSLPADPRVWNKQ